MKNEIVAYKDLYGNWACAFNIAISESNPTADPYEMIDLIKSNYPFLADNQFTVTEREIVVLTNEIAMINPGQDCVI